MKYIKSPKKGVPARVIGDDNKEVNLDEKARELKISRAALISRLARCATVEQAFRIKPKEPIDEAPPKYVAQQSWMVPPARSLL